MTPYYCMLDLRNPECLTQFLLVVLILNQSAANFCLQQGGTSYAI
jgi:hypothetical protein